MVNLKAEYAKGLKLKNPLIVASSGITETVEKMKRAEDAGHGGPWGIYYALHWLSAIYPEIKIPLSGSGGVTSGEDAVKFILSGASTVQAFV